jgi:hypothetical protein
MRRPRTTIRRVMAIVLLIGVVIWAGIAAERTSWNKARFHTHLQSIGDPNDLKWSFSETPEWVPFWPVYWRTVLGLRWDWRLQCIPGGHHGDVACEHDLPIFVHDHARGITDLNIELVQSLFGGQPSSGR